MELCGTDEKSQTERALMNTMAVLKALNSGLQFIVDATWFVHPSAKPCLITEAWRHFMAEQNVESTMDVPQHFIASTALPKGALVELKVVAIREGNAHFGLKHGLPMFVDTCLTDERGCFME